jgi:hypothetical protein
MSALGYRERKADPRCAMAAELFGTSAYVSRLGNGHARDNLVYSLQMSVLSPEESGYSPEGHAALLQNVVEGWIKLQFRAAWLGELERIRRSVLAKYPAA